MKKIAVSFLFVVALLGGEYTPIPYKELYPLLKSIDKEAILMGSGKRDVYVFIDPLCRYSKKFMKLTVSNPQILHKYRFHLFLYEIPRLHSLETINAVYGAKDRLQTLKEVMLKNRVLRSEQNLSVSQEIANVAQRIGVFKRPFIIVSHKE